MDPEELEKELIEDEARLEESLPADISGIHRATGDFSGLASVPDEHSSVHLEVSDLGSPIRPPPQTEADRARKGRAATHQDPSPATFFQARSDVLGSLNGRSGVRPHFFDDGRDIASPQTSAPPAEEVWDWVGGEDSLMPLPSQGNVL